MQWARRLAPDVGVGGTLTLGVRLGWVAPLHLGLLWAYFIYPAAQSSAPSSPPDSSKCSPAHPRHPHVSTLTSGVGRGGWHPHVRVSFSPPACQHDSVRGWSGWVAPPRQVRVGRTPTSAAPSRQHAHVSTLTSARSRQGLVGVGGTLTSAPIKLRGAIEASRVGLCKAWRVQGAAVGPRSDGP